jgi:hypothetical protein
MKSANGYSARRATPMKRPHRSLVPTPESRQSFTIALSPPRVPRQIAPRAGDGMLSLAGPIAFPIELLRGAASTLPAVKIAAVTAAAVPGFVARAALAPWLYGGLVLAWASQHPISAVIGRQIRIDGPLVVRWGIATHIVAEKVQIANTNWWSRLTTWISPS